MKSFSESYKNAGVDITAGYKAVELMKTHIARTVTPGVIGGLGGAVCEALAEACPVPVIRVGVEDKFGMSGKVPELLAEYGLTKENIIAKAKKAIALKK